MIEDEGKYDKIKLAKLLDAMQDDSLSEPEEQELQEILKKNKEARKTYLESTSMEDSLYWSNAENAVLPFPEKEEEKPQTGTEISLKAVLFAFAALMAVVFIIFASSQSQKGDSDPHLATVHEGPNVVWDKGPVNQRIEKGKLNLVSGIVEIVFDSGTRMKVYSPAEFEVISYNHARLNTGEIRVKVPEEALGFRLETEAANFVDIGTEFTVKVSDSQIAELHVIDGVVVARPNRGQSVVSFGKNQSGTIEPVFGEVRTIQSRYKSLDPLAPNVTESRYERIKPNSKIIFLGDRNTDFETYLHMVNQAIYDAEPESNISLLNAGMTLRFYNTDAEFQELVADLKPDYAVLAFGPEIAANDDEKAKYQIPPQDFEEKSRRLVRLLKKNNIIPIIMTGYHMNTRNPTCVKLLDSYNAILRQIAKENNFRLAEADIIYNLYKNTDSTGKLVDKSQRYATFEGYRVMARSVLNSLGYNNLKVPEKLRFRPLPGLIREWYTTDAVLKTDMLDKQKISELDYKNWNKLILPQPAHDKIAKRLLVPHQTYPIQARSLGVAMGITKDWRNKTRAVAEIYSEADAVKYLNLGEDIKSVWLNGEKVQKQFLGIYVDGRHPGFYRLPVKLKQGVNTLVIEAYNSFFASITNSIDWGLPTPPPYQPQGEN